MVQNSRREFLKTSTVAGLSVMATGYGGSSVASTSASDDVRVAIIGLGKRGRQHLDAYLNVKGARVVALCDCDRDRVGEAADHFKQNTSQDVAQYIDYRKLLERDDIDAVSIATPNYWHALMTIDACRAGKHVYVEKPVCHTIWEGRKMIEAAAKYGRIVAAGFQNRSDTGLRAGMDWLHEGHLGNIISAHAIGFGGRKSIGKRDTPLQPPKSTDYNLWLGPAQDLPIMRSQFHYDWHWVWNTGNGDVGNRLAHSLDLIRWLLGDPGHASQVLSYGGRFGWDDAGQTPNMQFASFDLGESAAVTCEIRNLFKTPNGQERPTLHDETGGVICELEGGRFWGARGGTKFFDTKGKMVREFKGDKGKTHFANFCEAVRTQDDSQLRSPLESAYISSCYSHLANTSYRLGIPVSPTELNREMENVSGATTPLGRFEDHLQDWKVDLNRDQWTLGPLLEFNNIDEQFVGENSEKANRLIRRDYREPWKVPVQV